MPDRRTALVRAPAIPAIFFGIAAAVCFLLSGRALLHWQPPFLAVGVLLAATSAGLALRSRVARWAAAVVSAAMVLFNVGLLYLMVTEFSHGMHSSNGVEAMVSTVAWVLVLVPVVFGIFFALFAAGMLSAPAREAFNAPRWDAVILLGVLIAGMLGTQWYRRADYYGEPCGRGDQYACQAFANIVPQRGAVLGPARDLCEKGDSLSAPEACAALGYAAWKRHDSTAAMPLFARACSARPRQYCYRIAHDPNVGLMPAQAAELYLIACSHGERASCEGLGKSLRATGDIPGASQALDMACRQGELSSCETLGDLQLNGRDTVSALRSFKVACEYNGMGCYKIAFIERVQGSVDADRWYSDDCQGPRPNATNAKCLAIADKYLAMADTTAARRFYLRACNWGLQSACKTLMPLRDRYEVPRPAL